MRSRYSLVALVAAAFAVGVQAQIPATFDPRPAAGSPAATGADFSAPRLQGGFFTPTTYRGAFEPGSGTAGRWDLPWANYDPQNANYGPSAGATVLEGNINANLTLNAGTRYLLRGFVNVNAGVTLTIPAGTVIFGEQTSRGSLIVNRGARLIANGTPDNPIIMTSAQPAGSRAPGDWGGLILAGRACINAAGGEATLEGGTGTIYGGGAACNDDDDSGIIRYLRLEYSGIAFAANNEINGITMGGVGRGTVMEYIQVSYNGDDSYEWFGGTVNGRYFISLGTIDDDFDGDIGWRGNVQFGLVVRDPANFDVSGSTALEQDNQTTESTATPRSAPTFSNVTVLGPLTQQPASAPAPNALFTRALHFRRATQANLYNSVVLGWPRGLTFDGPNVVGDAGTAVDIRHTILSGTLDSNQSGFDATAWFTGRPGNVNLPAANALFNAGLTNAGLFVVSTAESPSLPGVSLRVAPNPSVGPASLRLTLPAPQDVRVSVYDVLGREVAQVAHGPAMAGIQAYAIPVLPAGVYQVRLLTATGGVLVAPFTVVR